MKTQTIKKPTGLIVLPDEKAIRRRLLGVVKGDEAFVEGRLSLPLSKYCRNGVVAKDFVTRLLLAINEATQETPEESELEMIMFSRVPRYIDALVPEDMRQAAHARFERIKERTYA